MTEGEQIFIDQQQLQAPVIQDQNVRYTQNTQSDEFISQFLCSQNSRSIQQQKHESAPEIINKKHFDNNNHEIELQNCHPKKRQKSLFHNFQKHLVITLKKLIKIKSKPQDGIVGKVAQQMWEIFLKSNLYTKTILHILYGAEQQEQQQCSFTSSMLNKFGYVDLFNKYSQNIVKQTQQYLRQQTVNSLKRINIKQYLSKRRLSKSQYFEGYLNEFIQQLSQGPIKKRMPKQKKKNFNTVKQTSNSIE